MKYLQSLANNKTAKERRQENKEEQRKVQQAYMNQTGGNSELNQKMENTTPKNKL